jgi:hypothetical protein
VDRREHRPLIRRPHDAGTVAWSPSVISRIAGIGSASLWPYKWPQWSPPIIGGSTGLLPAGCPAAEGAAMEPAGNRQQDVGPLNGYDLMIVKPQRGPPIIGREHVQPIPAGDESVLRAAMEPATEEREHTRTGVGEPQGFLPQWSPPLTGGSMRDHQSSSRGAAVAAMEPAADRREHGLVERPGVDLLHTAMEPAGYWREHKCLDPAQVQVGTAPQWSPPAFSGSTGIRAGAAVAEFVPQWSPPPTGGDTAPRIQARLTCADRSAHERLRNVRWSINVELSKSERRGGAWLGVSRLPLLRWARGRLGISGVGCAVVRRRRRRRCRVLASLCGGRLEPGQRA